MGKKMDSIEDVLSEMMRLQSGLPSRPGPEEVEISRQTLARVAANLAARLEDLFTQLRPPGVPPPVFRAYQEMREDVLRAQAQTEKRMAMATMEIEERHSHFEALIQTVQSTAAHPLNDSAVTNGSRYDYKDVLNPIADGKYIILPSVSEDSVVAELGPGFRDAKSLSSSLGSHSGRLSAASTTDISASSGGQRSLTAAAAPAQSPAAPEVKRSVEEGPEGIQGFSPQLMKILERAAVKKLETLNLSSKELTWLPESIGLLTNLTSLDISGNRLQAVPESIGELDRLTLLDCQSNHLKCLPESLGCLTNLTTLNIQKNSIEDLPWTIGLCTALVELHADFNQLKALPQAVGHLTSLRFVSVHLNCIKSLPTTISLLTNLVELDLHFNHLESVPESLCFLPNLAKLDISSNFTALKELPKSIGQLQSLRELNISFNHITVLPDSFGMLTGLQKLELDGNPLRIPPLSIAQEGKEAVLEFMKHMLQQLEIYEKGRAKKSSLASLMTVFKKNKSAKFYKELKNAKLKEVQDVHVTA